jgi:hypothetical protein
MVHPEDGNCSVCHKVGTPSTCDMAKHREPNLYIKPLNPKLI